MKRFIVLIFIVIVVGCSPQKKLQRLTKRHPELLNEITVQLDTTIIHKHDPKSFNFPVSRLRNLQNKPIQLQKDGVKLEIRQEGGKIEITEEREPDTLNLSLDYTHSQVVQEEKNIPTWVIWGVLILVTCIVVPFFLRFIYQIYRKTTSV